MTRYTIPNLTFPDTPESNYADIPDPWTLINTSTAQTIPPPPHPLDISHEIGAAHLPAGYIPPQGDPTVLQIPAHTSEPSSSPFMTLLRDELKVKGLAISELWDDIQGALALLYWLNTEGWAIA